MLYGSERSVPPGQGEAASCRTYVTRTSEFVLLASHRRCVSASTAVAPTCCSCASCRATLSRSAAASFTACCALCASDCSAFSCAACPSAFCAAAVAAASASFRVFSSWMARSSCREKHRRRSSRAAYRTRRTRIRPEMRQDRTGHDACSGLH